MNDLNSSPSVSPGQKKVDIVSIIIALIATTFIITGTYLLVQALKPAARSTSSVAATSVRASSSKMIANVMTSSAPTEVVVASSSSVAASVAPVESSSSSVPAVSSVSTSSTVSSTTAVVAPITSGLKTGKTDAQILARVDGGDAQVTKLVVTESGFTGTRWLQKGAFVNVSNGTVPVKTVGTIYKINFLIGESQTAFEIKDISGVTKQ